MKKIIAFIAGYIVIAGFVGIIISTFSLFASFTGKIPQSTGQSTLSATLLFVLSLFIFSACVVAGVGLYHSRKFGFILAMILQILQIFQFYIGKVLFVFAAGPSLTMLKASEQVGLNASFGAASNISIGEQPMLHFYGINLIPILVLLVPIFAYFHRTYLIISLVCLMSIVFAYFGLSFMHQQNFGMLYTIKQDVPGQNGLSLSHFCSKFRNYLTKDKDNAHFFSGNYFTLELLPDKTLKSISFVMASTNGAGISQNIHVDGTQLNERRESNVQLVNFNETINQQNAPHIQMTDIISSIENTPWDNVFTTLKKADLYYLQFLSLSDGFDATIFTQYKSDQHYLVDPNGDLKIISDKDSISYGKYAYWSIVEMSKSSSGGFSGTGRSVLITKIK